mgnify:CR=1 FL=1
MHDLNWAQTDFMEQSQAFAEKIFADVRLLSQSPAPLTGVTRTSYSPEEGRVLKYLSDVCCGLGLQVETDPAGNVWGTLRGSDPELPAAVIVTAYPTAETMTAWPGLWRRSALHGGCSIWVFHPSGTFAL